VVIITTPLSSAKSSIYTCSHSFCRLRNVDTPLLSLVIRLRKVSLFTPLSSPISLGFWLFSTTQLEVAKFSHILGCLVPCCSQCFLGRHFRIVYCYFTFPSGQLCFNYVVIVIFALLYIFLKIYKKQNGLGLLAWTC
jgi:amino acid permease